MADDLSRTAPTQANMANLVAAAAPVPPPTKDEPPSLAPPVSEALAGNANDDPDDPDDPISEERNFREAHIVRGRARHPQSQGGIERRNGQFNEALQNWMQENNTTSWR